MCVAGAVGSDDGVVERSGGSALSSDLGGNALIDLRRQARIDEYGRFRLAEHVDEAGSDNFAAGVNGTLARGSRKIDDGGDAAVADSDVARVPRRAGAIHNVPVGDDEVEGRVGGKTEDGENQ